MKDRLKRMSTFLSLILRHKPEVIGIKLDSEGWVDIDLLIQQSQQGKQPFSRKMIDEIVANNDKQRFVISDDKTKIRANQGHSLDIDLNLPAKIPPGILYHGTAKRFLDQILKQGLQKQARRHVHLSADMQTALSVGARYGKVVILEVDTKTMRENNLVFYQAKNGVWLTDYVPEKYLTIIEV